MVTQRSDNARQDSNDMTTRIPLDLGITEEERAAWGLQPPAHIELHTHPSSGQIVLVICSCALGEDHRFDERCGSPAVPATEPDPWL